MIPGSAAAMDEPRTAAAWRRRIRLRTAWLVAELAAWAGTVAAGVARPDDDSIGLAVRTTAAVLVLVPVTAWTIISARRVGRILRTYAWEPCPCVFDSAGRDTQISLRPEPGRQAPFRTVPFRYDLSRDGGERIEEVWFAGDFRYGGVVSPPGGHRPIRVIRANLKKASPRAEPGADTLAEKAGLTRAGRARSAG
ncbi:hypothetical protein AB0C51_17655 [Streptomyces pathocidini]|uniref:hypothetical protein n=1 Tax=Streptomyces pathocidini TaxID=1650571 RepID=UPI0033FFDEC0